MINLILPLLLLAFAQEPSKAEPAHFKFVRDVQVRDTGKPNYVLVDEQLWRNSEKQLGDARLFVDAQEVPYALQEQRGRSNVEYRDARLLNKSRRDTRLQFIVDTSLEEYDHVQLQITKKDFVAQAKVEASDDLAKGWSQVGTFTIFDLTVERLGCNTTLRFKTPMRYKYLLVTITGPLQPDDLTGARHSLLQEQKARYTDWSAKPEITRSGRKTSASWTGDKKLPLERVELKVPSATANFSRNTTLYCDDSSVRSEDLHRIKLVRKNQKIESEDLAIDPGALRCERYRVEIDNADDPPLAGVSVQPQFLERRVYFEPKAASLQLYYGDEVLASPSYDYAKFFRDGEAAVPATVGEERKNPNFTPRPDSRPFTERYPAVLWTAFILAVIGLGYVALRGFKQQEKPAI